MNAIFPSGRANIAVRTMNSVFQIDRSRLAIRTIPKIPSHLVGVGGIGVSKENGVWTIEPAWDDLALITPGILLDPTSKEVWVHDPATDVYYRMTLAGLGQAMWWGTSSTSVLIGAGSKTFETQSGKNWLPGMFVQAFSTANPTNYIIGQVTAYAGTTLTLNTLAIGGSGSFSDWTLVPSALPGAGGAGASGSSSGFNYNFVAGLSGDPGSGNVGFNSGTIASITSIRIHDVDRNGVNLASEIATWDDSTTSTNRGKIKIYSTNAPAKYVIATISGAATDLGVYTSIPVSAPIGATLPDAGNCQIEVTRTGDSGSGGGGGTSVTISDTAPATPAVGDLWWESDTGILWIRYDDGTSVQWVQVGAGGASGGGAYLPLTGGIISGDLTVTGNLNAKIGGDISSFRAHKNGVDQGSFPDGVWTKVTFGTADFNVGSNYSTVNSRWTPPAGVIICGGILSFGGFTTVGSYVGCAVYKNGVAIAKGNYPTAANNSGVANLSIMDNANGTDFYELYGYFDATSGLPTCLGPPANTLFTGTRMDA